MSHGPDPRILTVPLSLFGGIGLAIGLVGLTLRAMGVADIANPGGLAGAGLTMLVAALAVTLAGRRTTPAADEKPDIVPIPLAPRQRHNRRVAGIVGGITILLLAAGVYGAGFAGIAAGGDDHHGADVDALAAGPDATASTLLGDESFTGTLQGATLPAAGGAGTPEAFHELDVLAGTDAFHHELTWGASTGGASQLYLALEIRNGDAWEEVERVAGGSKLLLALDELPMDAEGYRLHVGIPDGAGSTPLNYEITAHYYAGGLPG